MPINTGDYARALKPGVNSWFGMAYDQYPEEWSKIFDVYQSDMYFEEDVNSNGLGLAVAKPEGQAMTYGSMSESFIQRYSHIVYALGYIVTREAIEDNLYVKLAQQRTQALAMSMKQTKENVSVNILNRAFNSSYTGGDGLCLINSAHKLSKGGTFSNQIATAADLSESALEQALIDIGGYVNDASLRIAVMGDKLIIPRQLQFEAERILKSSNQNDSANNAINAMKNIGVLPGGVVLNHYLSSSVAWFIKTNAPDGLKLFQRRSLEVDNDTEFETENMKFKASERYSVGWTDPRGLYGSAGV